MIKNLRKSTDRGHADHGWLNSFHTFSFGGYYDPAHMGFRSLRVINEDRVAPGKGFGEHPHRDMEIISYVIEGALAHQDSMGNGSTITPGRFQRLTAGSGITHSEFNHSTKDPVHFLQIWIQPGERGLPPSYQEASTDKLPFKNGLKLAVSGRDTNAPITISSAAEVLFGQIDAGQSLAYPVESGRGIWIQMIAGALEVEDTLLSAGDGLSLEQASQVRLSAAKPSEFLLFDLA